VTVPNLPIDAIRGRDLVAEADSRSSTPEIAVELLDEALRLWRGHA